MIQDFPRDTEYQNGATTIPRVLALTFCFFTLAVSIQSNNQVPVLFDSEPLGRSLVFPFLASLFCGSLFPLHKIAMRRAVTWLDLTLAIIPAILIFLRSFGIVSPWILAPAAFLLALVFARLAFLMSPDTWRTPRYISIAMWLVFAVGGILVSYFSPIDGFQFIGALTLGILWLGLILFGVSILCEGHWWRRLAFIGLLGVFLLNENQHFIAQTDLLDRDNEAYVFPKEFNRSTLAPTAFYSWLAQRENITEFVDSGRPYPIFIVASEGGGGYAAAHAYTFLSKTQARCPQFLNHTFALVGVSGGAIGNSMFYADNLEAVSHGAGQKCDRTSEDTPFRPFENPDLLSPVIGTMLFRDFPNRLSFGLLGDFDRSDALMDALRNGRDNQPLAAGYTNHFWELSADAEPSVRGGPAIISVATDVDTGSRYLFAPFQMIFQYGMGRYGQFLSDMNIGLEPIGAFSEANQDAVRVSADIDFFDAAVTSAAFPWVSPSRILEIPYWGQSAGNLVDGGYYEGTGAETVADLHAELTFLDIDPFSLEADRSNLDTVFLTRGCEELKIAIIRTWPENITPDQACVLNITFHSILIRTALTESNDASAPGDQSFFLDPINAVLSTRGQRSREALSNLLQEQCRGCDPLELIQFLHEGRVHESILDLETIDMPLGWLMPEVAIRELEQLVANLNAPDMRETFDLQEPERSFGQTSSRNAGELERIIRALEGQ